MITTQGKLVVLNVETGNPKIFWEGEEVTDLISIRIHWEDDEHSIKLKVAGAQTDIYDKMRLSGIVVKESKNV